ncbi:prolyl oligopeptidase family serine peptidase [Sandarakinorhabdus sp.]|uniref:prolyl oligopeptidase family serine peptidase n=1 Tax=Sandarakinorhabdus sp. TaxID=1916663 RepID=UPI003F6EE582
MTRHSIWIGAIALALSIGALPAAAQRLPDTPVAGTASVAGTSLTLDALYQPQSIVGNEPVGFVWAPDGAVLFLWNADGRSFRDVWRFHPGTGQKQRLTFLGTDAKAEQAGIGQVVALGDGRIAYTLGGQLFTQAADGTSARIAADSQGIRKLGVSPDGQSLAYVAGGDLWVMPAAGTGPARRLVGSDNAKIYVSDYHWSDGSDAIAFEQSDDIAMPERDIFYHAKGELRNNRVIRAFPGEETTKATVGVVNLANGAVRMFDRPDPKHHVWGFGLSGDGKRLFVSGSDMEAKEHTIYLYDVASGQRETFYQLREAKHLRTDWQVAWAPGDDGLIILTDRDGWLHLYHQRTAGGVPRQITRGEWEIASFAVDRKNRQLHFVANKSYLSDRSLYRVPLSGGAVQPVGPQGHGTHEPVYSPDFAMIADWYSNDSTPPELHVVDTRRPGRTVQVTNSPRPEFQQQTWAKVGYIEFASHVDGQTLLGRVSLPANYDPARRYPLIVGSVYSDAARNQWGGRRAHPTWGIDQYFVSQGYIVLNVNVRGSWGQGRAHNQSQYHSYGETDINDLESGVRHLVAKGFVDPRRVGLWGSSYGGLMTIMSLAKKPGVYAAGIAGAPATNVWHAYPAQMWIMGNYQGPDMPARYEAQSALYQAKGIRDPLMIIHGTRDPVVLYSDTTTLAEQMIQREQMFELVTLPGANHAWASDNLPQTRFAFRKMVDFFNRNVRDRP